jgi:hypothetical protein
MSAATIDARELLTDRDRARAEHRAALDEYNIEAAVLRTLEAGGTLDGTPLDSAERTLALYHSRDRVTAAARAVGEAKELLAEAERVAGNADLVRLGRVYDKAAAAVLAERSACEAALIELTAHAVRFDEACERELMAARAMRKAIREAAPKVVLDEQTVPIELCADGSIDTKRRPGTGLLGLRYGGFNLRSASFGGCVFEAVRNGRHRLQASEHEQINATFGRRVAQRLAVLDGNN